MAWGQFYQGSVGAPGLWILVRVLGTGLRVFGGIWGWPESSLAQLTERGRSWVEPILLSFSNGERTEKDFSTACKWSGNRNRLKEEENQSLHAQPIDFVDLFPPKSFFSKCPLRQSSPHNSRVSIRHLCWRLHFEITFEMSKELYWLWH